MKLPTKLVIGGYVYTAQYTRAQIDTDVYRKDLVKGQIEYMPRVIRVWRGERDKPLPIEDVYNSLMHEVIHAVLDSMHLARSLIPERQEEDFVNDLAAGIADALLRNKLVELPEN